MRERNSESGSPSYWAEVYDVPPLDRLERLAQDTVFEWLNREVPSIGTSVDWRPYGEDHRHWFSSSAEARSSIVGSFCRRSLLREVMSIMAETPCHPSTSASPLATWR